MLQLLIDDISLDLRPDARIPLNIETALFQYGKITGTQSFPFSLPDTEKNRKFFQSPHHHQRKGSAFHQVYQNAQIRHFGKLIFVGTLELEESNHSDYKAIFKADAATLSEFGKEKIRELLKAEEWHFSDTSLEALENYTAKDSVITFPVFQIGEVTFNNYAPNGKYQRDLSGTGGLIPFFNLMFIAQLLFRQLGYQLQNVISEPDFQFLILFNQRELFSQEVPILEEEHFYEYQYNWDWASDHSDIGEPPEQILKTIQVQVGTEYYLPNRIRIADHIPDLTLSEFLDGLRKLFALSIRPNSREQVFRFRLLRDILDSREYIERTPQAESRYRKKKVKYEGYTFGFQLDGDDNRLSNAPENLDLSRYLGEATGRRTSDNKYQDEILANFEKYRLFYVENAYYRVGQMTQDGTAEKTIYPYQFYADAVFPKKIGEGKMKIETPFSPVPKIHYRYEEFGTITITEGKDKRLRIELDEVLPQRYKKAYFIFKNSHWYPNNIPIGIWEFTAEYVDLNANALISANTSVQEFVFEHRYDEEIEVMVRFGDEYRFLPYVEVEPYRPKLISEDGSENKSTDFAPRLLFYHGKQPWNHPTHQDFPYASSDNFNSIHEQIGNIALNWHGEYGLFEKLHKPYVDFFRQTEEVHYRMRLTVNDLMDFDPEIKWRIREMNYFVKKISAVLTHHGVEVSKVILLKAGEGICKNELVVELYHVCVNTLDIVEQHLCINTLDVVEQHLCVNTLDVVEQHLCSNTLMIEEFYVENDGTAY